MKATDLLTTAEIDKLVKARDTALDMQEVLKQLRTYDLPYEEHMQKANEQVDYLNKIFKAFELDKAA